jgi:pyridoxamine 5'-phosphate oxidase
LERQVRIEGKVHKVSADVSDAYFASRPRLSQAGALVSSQSQKIQSRDVLDKEMERLMSLPETETFERPEHWGRL